MVELTHVFPGAALHIKRVVALFLVGVAVLEKESVGAKFGFRHIIDAFIVEIALLWIREKSVLLGAIEVDGYIIMDCNL